MKLIQSVGAYADSYGMLDCTDVIVGYSGGADSSLLLFVLSELSKVRGFSIICAHVNHMLRGDEADADEEFCRARCKALGIEFRSLRTDVEASAKERGVGVEERAREIRYGFFDSIKLELEQKGRKVRVAIAHNATDNAETVLFNFARGSTISGMCGIPPVRDGYIVRPLLRIPKERVLELCSELGIEYATDKTNAECVYTRNKIRHNALPTLRGINPSLEAAVSRMTASLREDAEYLDRAAKEAYPSVKAEDRSLSCGRLTSLHSALRSRVLCLFFDECGAGYEYTHIDSVQRLLERGGDFSLSLIGSIRLVCKGGVLFTEADKKDQTTEIEPWQVRLNMGDNPLPSGAHVFLFSKKEDAEKLKTQNVYKLFIQHTLSGDTICNVFVARTKKDGDRIRYGGHSHKLKKLYSEMKIPSDARPLLPIIERDGEIVWIPNVKAADTSRGDGVIYAVFAIS